MNILAFDIFADYAMFRKYYTTMSPLSFAIPGGTVIRGILGAIVGIDKTIAPEYFLDVKLALKILKPIKKVTIPENLLKTTSTKHFSRYEQHKPTNIEFVKDPHYRFYVAFEKTQQKGYEELKKMLVEHKSFYSVSFGISEALANFGSIEEPTIIKELKGLQDINSIFPSEQVVQLEFGESEVFTAVLPMKMKNDREVLEYKEVLYERNAKPIKAELKNAVQLSTGENVVFF